MKKSTLIQSAFALGLGLLSSCSLTPDAPKPATPQQSANNVPCETCPPGGGGDDGGGGYQPTCVAPTSAYSSRIVREARLYAIGKAWTDISVTVGTIGCDDVYPFSIDFKKRVNGVWVATWTSGTYDIANGTISVPEYDYPNP